MSVGGRAVVEGMSWWIVALELRYIVGYNSKILASRLFVINLCRKTELRKDFTRNKNE